ncbi:MAG: glycosyltransferase family A protein [archaeon]
MIKKLNIIIPTRNPKNIERTLNKLFLSKLQINKIIIIDDSTSSKENKKLKKSSLKYKKLILVNKDLIKRIKIPTILGLRSWNLGNAKNIGALFSLAISKDSLCMFLDDDILLEESKKNIFFKKEIKKKRLIKIKLRGSPDLSRIEWIELYLKNRDKKIKLLNKYIEKIYSSLGNDSISLFSEYTEIQNRKVNYKSKKYQKFPQRRELSGGAFICDSSLFKKNMFANWFDEDWLWFFYAKKNKNVKRTSLPLIAYHLPKKKKILDLDRLKFEETGKILTNILKKRLNKNINNLIDIELKKREKIISFILYNFQRIDHKNTFDRKIILHLQEINKWLKNYKRELLISNILKYQKDKKDLFKNKEKYLKNIRSVLNE